MADLLTRMVERTLGVAPTVRPIIAPIFASGLSLASDHAAGSPTSDAVPGQEYIPTPTQRLGQTAVPQPPLASLRHEGPDSVTASTAPPRANRRHNPPLFTSALPGVHPADPQQIEQRVTSDEDEYREHPAGQRIDLNREPLQALESSQHGELLVPNPLAAFQTPQELLAGTAAPQLPTPVEMRSDAVQALSTQEQLTPEAVRADVPQFPTPSEMRSGAIQGRSAPSGKSLVNGVPEPEPVVPTIRVSIGRIVVRAVTPPAPSEPRPAPKRPTPALSLDDYLKRGGRR